MDIRDLFLSCRKGDLEKVKCLVEQKDVDVNIRDRWDSTPLYYACLCGHFTVVQYLLHAANTFDGERCIYGALSQEIRNLLKDLKVVSKQTIRRELYTEFLRRLLESGEFSDIKFIVHGREFMVHKCVLSARSEYLMSKLLGSWNKKSVIHVTHELVTAHAFRAVLQFIYTGQCEAALDSIGDIKTLARQFKLHSLVTRLEQIGQRARFFQDTKPGVRVTSLLVESPPQENQLSAQLSILAEEALPDIFASWIFLPFHVQPKIPFIDVIFDVQGHEFACHKCFFCGRSDYFKTIMCDPLKECVNDPQNYVTSLNSVTVVPLHTVSPDIFIYILYHIYQENVKLDSVTIFDVLIAADMFLLASLKRQCALFLGSNLEINCIILVLKTARMFNLNKLQDECFQFMAENLELIVEDPEFHSVVLEDANLLEDRQETDTIDIIDNIRYHLTSNSLDEAHDKLQLIENMLTNLNLEA